MPYVYTTITAEQRVQMIDDRIGQLEGEHFAHEMNKAALSSLPPSPEKDDATEAADAAQATIEGAIAAAALEKTKIV